MKQLYGGILKVYVITLVVVGLVASQFIPDVTIIDSDPVIRKDSVFVFRCVQIRLGKYPYESRCDSVAYPRTDNKIQRQY